MTRIRFSPLAFVFMVAAISVIVYTGRYVRANRLQPESPNVAVISAPKTWQPFEAVITLTRADAPTITGVFHRASDGSERRDEQTADGDYPALRAIVIMNPTAGWQAACNLILSVCKRSVLTGPRKIPLRRETTRGLAKTENTVEGFGLYQYIDAKGLVSLQAPALNFLPVVEDLPDGSHVTLTQIRRGEQPPSLFELPAVVRVDDVAIPQAKK
jgi:hypothetical protein